MGAGKAWSGVIGERVTYDRYYAVNCSHWRNPRHNNIVINACRCSCILIEGECEEENDGGVESTKLANVFEQ